MTSQHQWPPAHSQNPPGRCPAPGWLSLKPERLSQSDSVPACMFGLSVPSRPLSPLLFPGDLVHIFLDMVSQHCGSLLTALLTSGAAPCSPFSIPLICKMPILLNVLSVWCHWGMYPYTDTHTHTHTPHTYIFIYTSIYINPLNIHTLV